MPARKKVYQEPQKDTSQLKEDEQHRNSTIIMDDLYRLVHRENGDQEIYFFIRKNKIWEDNREPDSTNIPGIQTRSPELTKSSSIIFYKKWMRIVANPPQIDLRLYREGNITDYENLEAKQQNTVQQQETKEEYKFTLPNSSLPEVYKQSNIHKEYNNNDIHQDDEFVEERLIAK